MLKFVWLFLFILCGCNSSQSGDNSTHAKEGNIDYMREWIDIRTYETEREAIDCLNEIKKGVLDEFGKFKEIVIEEYEI